MSDKQMDPQQYLWVKIQGPDSVWTARACRYASVWKTQKTHPCILGVW